VNGNKASGKTAITIILIAVVFVAVLAGSIGLQLAASPDFSGFKKEPLPDPDVNRKPATTGETENGAAEKEEYNWKDHPVFIIGDSLTQGARKEIAKVVPDSTIDAKTNRDMSTGVSILGSWEDSGVLPDDAIIVICLANNITDTTVGDAQQIVDMIKPGQSLIMMTGHGRSNMTPANEFIRSLPRAYPFITVADWDLTVAQSPSLLSDDGIHIARNQGNELYAELILRALEATQPMPQM